MRISIEQGMFRVFVDYQEYMSHLKGHMPPGMSFNRAGRFWYLNLHEYPYVKNLIEFVEKFRHLVQNDPDAILAILRNMENNIKIINNRIYVPLKLGQDYNIILEIADIKNDRCVLPDCIGSRLLLNYIFNEEVLPLQFTPRQAEYVHFDFLMDHQIEGVKTILEKYKAGFPGFILADEMGLGKTVQAIAFYMSVKRSNPNTKLMIVATKSTLYNVWQSDLQKFFNLPSRILTAKELKDLLSIEDIVITNYEAVAHAHSRGELDSLNENYILIADETTKVKNYTKNLVAMMHLRGDSFVLALSGTPIENNVQELENILKLITNNKFMPHVYFQRGFMRVEEYIFGNKRVKKVVAARNERILHELLKPFMLRRTKDKIVNHAINVKTIVVDITNEQERLINELRRLAKQRYSDDLIQRYACSVLIKRINDHPKLLELGDSEIARSLKVYDYTSPKLEVLKELVDKVDKPVIIFTEYDDMAQIIAETLSEKYRVGVIDGSSTFKVRTGIIYKTKTGEYDVLVSTDALAFGVNLQFANTLINYDLPWNPAKRAQRINRIHRLGSTEFKTVYDILTSDIDMAVQRVLEKKKQLFEAVIDGKQNEDTSLKKEIIEVVLNEQNDQDTGSSFEDTLERLLKSVR